MGTFLSGSFVLSAFTIFFSHFLNAQQNPPIKLDGKRPLKIEYKNPSWNRDPKTQDKAALLIRDAISGKTAKLELYETENNNSIFSGQYGVSWSFGDVVTPEVYVAPLEQIASPEQLSKVALAIRIGRYPRKPYFVRTVGRFQVITVYNSREEALAAFEESRKNPQGKSPVDESLLELQQKAALELEQKKLAEEANKQDLERKKLEAIEAQKKQRLLLLQQQLSEAEKVKRKIQAQAHVKNAMNFFNNNDFVNAESQYEKAVQLDPENYSFYLNYAIALFRNNKFDKTIAILNLSPDEKISKTNKRLYLGLSYFQLKDNEKAYKNFLELKAMPEDKNLSATGAFYAGLIDFQRDKLDEAKQHFEYVLDNGEDKELDSQSDIYLETIAARKIFLEEKNKKFKLTLNLGSTYDSNMLSTANSAKADSTIDLDGFRHTYGGSVEYRSVYTMLNEFSSILSVTDNISTTRRFGNLDEFKAADSRSTSFSLPYKYKGPIFEKSNMFIFTPSIEFTNVDSDLSGDKELTTRSYVGRFETSTVMADDWYSANALEYRKDNNLVTSSQDTANDNTATKYSFTSTNTLFLDDKKTNGYIFEFGVSQNNAEGSDQKFNRLDLGATYMLPVFEKSSFTSKLGYFMADYPIHSTGRKDNSWGATVGLRNPLSDAWTLAWTANYSLNGSTNEASDHNKYSLGAVLTWSDSF